MKDDTLGALTMARLGNKWEEGTAWVLLAACCLVFAGFATLWVQVIQRLSLDYWDGINFLLQARRLTDPDFASVPLDLWRPRSMVALLGSFDVLYRGVTGTFPSLTTYHFYMALLSALFLGASFLALDRLWDKRTAALALLFLLLCQILHHYSMMILADMVTGLFWMLAVLVYVHRSPEEAQISLSRAAAVGMLGALAGMGKYHFLLLVPVTLFVHFLTSPKKFAAMFGVAAFSYLATLEMGFRVFSGGEAGTAAHAVALFQQALVAARLHRPPEIYIEGLYLMYGPVFWAMTLMALGLAVKKINLRKIPLRRRAVLTSCVFHAVLTQVITQRETRYLLPLLPLILGLIASLIFLATQGLTVRARIWWTLLWMVALLYPFSRSRNDLQTTLEAPVYLMAEKEMEKFWNAFSERGLNGERCSKIVACAHSLRSHIWEFPKDQYYRSFDLGPHYTYFTKLPVTLKQCPSFTSEEGLIQQSLQSASDAHACYVLPIQSAHGHSLAIVRRLPAEEGRRAANGFALASTMIDARVKCEGEGDDVMCWSVREFFKAQSGQS